MFLRIWLFNLITSLMLLQHCCIITCYCKSSLSLFLVIDVTISVTCSKFPKCSEGSTNSKTGICDNLDSQKNSKVCSTGHICVQSYQSRLQTMTSFEIRACHHFYRAKFIFLCSIKNLRNKNAITMVFNVLQCYLAPSSKSSVPFGNRTINNLYFWIMSADKQMFQSI